MDTFGHVWPPTLDPLFGNAGNNHLRGLRSVSRASLCLSDAVVRPLGADKLLPRRAPTPLIPQGSVLWRLYGVTDALENLTSPADH